MKSGYQDLEYDALKAQIRQRCHSLPGQDKVDLLLPMADITAIELRLRTIGEIMEALAHGIAPDYSDLSDPEPIFEAQTQGIFSFEELHAIYLNALIANAVHALVDVCAEWKVLQGLVKGVRPLKEIAARFTQIFDAEGQVLDSASAELARIRKRGVSLRGSILKTMQSMLSDPGVERHLQDKFVTQREDRYVLPVKEGGAPSVPGIVQGYSGSRSTLFVEPAAVVPLNNELQMLKQDEKREIHRIISEFSAEVTAQKDPLLANAKALAELDFLFACGKLGRDLKAQVPKIAREPRLKMISARHPLLIIRSGGPEQVVPFDLELGGDTRILVLSGPNTGGKTVLMKSVGLLSLMALSGLPIPASADSEIGLFDGVFADIGDDQSIAAALSTFSSHVDKIRRMLDGAGENSLVLIDEIGAATDPQQGSALAQAMLERFSVLGCKCIVTTHYTALKIFAEQDPAAQNASMQFDTTDLHPTYRFATGFPGDSFAIEVAASLGLDAHLIERAKSLSGIQNREFTELLYKMQEEKKTLARESYEYRLKKRNLEARLEEIDKRSESLDAELKERKQRFLKDLQTELIARQKLYSRELDEIKQLERSERKAVSERKLHDVEEELGSLRAQITDASLIGKKRSFAPKPGDRVWLSNFEAEAIVLEVRENSALVDMNGISFQTTLDTLYESASHAQKPKPGVTASAMVHAPARAAYELKLLGLTFDEAAPLIDEFIDNAVLAGLHSLRIVHGKGTGALRTKVRDYLKRKKQVQGVDTPPPSEGGSGVTLVKI